ncbi:hypothetical protein F5Y14DRAFT_283342 [Nemania sp. NC0429]|nr:hypothetical protein F5Y14DRAFT_283342 [Nemania sp. NC0429]
MSRHSVPAVSSESCSPAPYGQSCEACARAKCKCFYRTPPETGCERCHRRGIACKQSIRTRKRKARAQSSSISPPASPSASALASASVSVAEPPSTRLEAKLDDLVSLLRSQAVEKQTLAQAQALQTATPVNSSSTGAYTPSATSVTAAYSESLISAPPRDPDVLVDMTRSAVRLVRPNSPPPISSPILQDVLAVEVSERVAEEQLYTFRSAFLSMFPFVHLPPSVSASQLRYQRPFLWLVTLALTTKSVSQQFAMEEMIWHIISRRIVSEHLADLDLLLGVVCFASWSHYFKKDKPFMNKLTQLALSLTTELGLHKDASTNHLGRENPFGTQSQNGQVQKIRTLEERRTILAVFHLTSSTWAAYRKTEPLRWNRYLDECLRILGEADETIMDSLLITQIKCQLITHQVTYPKDDLWGEDSPTSPSEIVAAALLGQVEDLQRSLPPLLRSERTAQFYINSTKLTIQSSVLSRPIPKDHAAHLAQQLQRVQDADATLRTTESWLATFFEMPLFNWTGINVDLFAQLTHCLVVLFNLTTLETPGWDAEAVRRRADVFEMLDRAAETVDRVPATLGIVDAEGPRRGLLFKTSYLFRAIKTLFLAEMGPQKQQYQQQNQKQQQQQQQQALSVAQDGAVGFGDDAYVSDEFLMSLWDEPWFSDILRPL